MKKFLFPLLLIFLFSFLNLSCAKKPPVQIPEVIRFQTRYSVNKNRLKQGIGGYIEAFHIERNIRLWNLQVYDQKDYGRPVFITSIRVGEGSLIVENDANETFEVGLRNNEIKKIANSQNSHPKEKTCECKCLQKK